MCFCCFYLKMWSIQQKNEKNFLDWKKSLSFSSWTWADLLVCHSSWALWKLHLVSSCFCSFLTRIAAVVIGVTVESVKLCGDGGGVAHQQEYEAHSHHFGARQRFARYHLQRVSVAMPTFLGWVSEDGSDVKMKCWENKAALPPRLLQALDRCGSASSSQVPLILLPPFPLHLLPLVLTLYPTPFKLRSSLFPAHFIPLPPSPSLPQIHTKTPKNPPNHTCLPISLLFTNL